MTTKNQRLIDAWLTWMRHNQGRAPGTLGKYQKYVEGLAAWLDKRGLALAQADKAVLEEFTGPHLHTEGVTPRSRKPWIAAIRMFYRWAWEHGQLPADPAESLKHPKVGEKLPRGMTLSNAQKLLVQPDLATFLGVRDSAILHLFLGTGIRLAGLINLNEEDLFFNHWQDEDLMFIRVTEKGDKERMVPVPDEVRVMLHAYLGHPELEAINRELPSGQHVLFVSTMNRLVPEHEYYGEERRISRKSVQEMIERYAHQAGIPRDQAHPHALRHTYGTELAESDVALLKMQALMGHADANSTRIYTHVAMRSLAKSVDKANPLAKIKTPATDLARKLR